MSVLPIRRDDLVIRSLGREALVLDKTHNRAHSLNPVAAEVLAACDGRTTRTEMAAALGCSAETIDAAVDQLREVHLVQVDGFSRRTLLSRSAVVAGGAVVATVVVPAAMAHASGSIGGGTGGGTITLGAVRSDAVACRGGYDLVSTHIASGPFAVPSNGTITDWSTWDFGGDYTFEVWRPTSDPSSFTLVAKSAPQSLTGSGTKVTFTLASPIAVQAGDLIGYNEQGGGCVAVDSSADSPFVFTAAGAPTVGTTETFNDYSGYALNLEATFAPS